MAHRISVQQILMVRKSSDFRLLFLDDESVHSSSKNLNPAGTITVWPNQHDLEMLKLLFCSLELSKQVEILKVTAALHGFSRPLSPQWPALWLWTQTQLILCWASRMTCVQSRGLKTACPVQLIPNVLTTGRRSSPCRPSPPGLTTGSWKPRDSGMLASATEVLGGRAKKAMRLGTTRYT